MTFYKESRDPVFDELDDLIDRGFGNTPRAHLPKLPRKVRPGYGELTHIALEAGLSRADIPMVHKRLERGWTLDQALQVPKDLTRVRGCLKSTKSAK